LRERFELLVPPRRCEKSRTDKQQSSTLIVRIEEGPHLQAFLDQQGVSAIVKDYAVNARLFTEAKVYRGEQEIRGFFMDFIGSLPPGGIDHFSLRSLHVDGGLAYVTWSVGSDIPLGTDTFVVDNGKIVSQTFAMHAVPAQ